MSLPGSLRAAEMLRRKASLAVTAKEAVFLDQLLAQYQGAAWLQKRRRMIAKALRQRIKKLRYIR